ncbi:hypothetical protein V1517DRAFT_311861 [Lipomyces orientalis]|uniref:Uncharacterized protein n=1 Tax=Lipomyces orientalis TaxID=1233043 RepID=A0ACC3TYP6_9ASCO
MVSTVRHQIHGRGRRHLYVQVNNADSKSLETILTALDPARIALSMCYIVSFTLVCCFIYDDCNKIFVILQHPHSGLASELINYIIKAILIAGIIRLVCRLGLIWLSAYFYGFFYLRDVCAGVLSK